MSFDQLLYKQSLLEITPANFEQKAMELFQYQATFNTTYRQYIKYLGKNADEIKSSNAIPFMPIEFFKSHTILTGDTKASVVFESSGTTGEIRSKHFVTDTELYKKVSLHFFEQIYGNISNYHLFALLPSYLERTGSSLVYMVDYFIKKTDSAHSGFYLNNTDELIKKITRLQQDNTDNKKILLIGVTFALLDLAEQHELDWSNIIVMETGGMKGRREELTREEIHEILKQRFHVNQVHSEYGMTELLSQGYSQGEGVFTLPPWMRIHLRDINDPFHINNKQRAGGINIIDLANVDSCAFIETRYIGSLVSDNQFKVLGRIDNSDIRGCNLLVL